MGTLVCLHAHPDDEAIATGGTIARASAEGHRVVLIVATGGEWGEVPEDLVDGESLHQRRVAEVGASAAALGIHRVVWLGYEDSGMTGWEQNGRPNAFMNAPIDRAAAQVAAILTEEEATCFTIYDWHGNYGHPDHVQVYRVGSRAAQLAGIDHVYEATMNRDFVAALMSEAARAGAPVSDFDVNDTDDGNPFGLGEHELTTAIDVSEYIAAKRASLMAHRSQITDTSFFLQMPTEMFNRAFGTEWFRRHGHDGPIRERWLAGL
jgi:LmbE family N-acetylglucosaminyl deacetylase